ncbi:DUF4326 domain-containing protein [Streptomyces sp. SD15]
MALMMVLLVWLIAVGLVSFAFKVEVRGFRPVVAVLGAVRACGSVYGTAGPQRTDGLWSFAVSMEGVRRRLRRAHRVRGTRPYRGGRRKAVRAHVRRVVHTGRGTPRARMLINAALLAQVPALRGKTLACWCAPELCHGDILAEIADGSTAGPRPA